MIAPGDEDSCAQEQAAHRGLSAVARVLRQRRGAGVRRVRVEHQRDPRSPATALRESCVMCRSASIRTKAAASRDVSVTPDGVLALVRHEGSSELDFIDLSEWRAGAGVVTGTSDGSRLSPDATRAYAVVRARAEEVPEGSAGGGGEGGVAGESGLGDAADRVAAASARRAAGGEVLRTQPTPRCWSCWRCRIFGTILPQSTSSTPATRSAASRSPTLATSGCSTRTRSSDHLVIVEMEGEPSDWELRTVVTKAPVKAVFPAPDGKHAIAFLGQLSGSSMPGGYSIVPLLERLPPRSCPPRRPGRHRHRAVAEPERARDGE